MKKLIYSFLFVLCSVFALQAESMVVATYNLRNANAGDSTNGNGWGQRYPYIAQLVQFHGFDIFGTQEGKYHQLQDLKNAMPGYDYIGVGRDDGKQTGFTFLFFNLHMDHIGVQARAESAKLILKKLKEFPEKLPAILTGDFNVDQHNESYLLLDNSGIMRDSYQIADFRYVPNGTFNAFHADRKTDSRIDHLFLTKEFDVKKYGVLTDTYRSEAKDAKNEQNANFPKEVSMQKHVARVPSDHFPVMIVVEVK